jgi:hypothetical protein
METIPIDFVRDRVRQFYKLTDTNSDSYIDLMILDSIRDFKSYQYVDFGTFNVDLCDGKGELPCNWKKVIAVLPPCDEGCQPIAYTDYIVDGCNCCGIADRFSIQGNTIAFPSNFEHESVRVVCQIFRVDSDGFPILIKDHLTYYVRYATYHTGLFLGDKRGDRFINFKQARKNIIHNEKADQFELDRHAIEAINHSISNARITFEPRYNMLGDGREHR